MNDTELFNRLAISLAIGLLVGLQRGWQAREAEEHSRAAGLRTFALTGLLGGLAGALGQDLDASITAAALAALAAAYILFHWLSAQASGDVSVTSVVAGMVTFLLGTTAVVGDPVVATAGGVATAGLLSLRDPLHRWLASVKWTEVRAVLILLTMTFLMLPVLPDRAVDPLAVINPREIWGLAVLVAALSFVGYVAVRLLGDRAGILVTATAGGLASSTATTLVLARLGRQQPASARLISAGILACGTVMPLRVVLIASALDPALFPVVGPAAFAGAGLLAAGATILVAGRGAGTAPALEIENPLAVGTALKLAGFVAVITLAAEAGRRLFGGQGLLAVAALSGLADVDAVTLSVARLDATVLAPATGGQAILLAMLVNTVTKAVMAGWIGGPGVGRPVMLTSLIAVAGSTLAYQLA